MSVHLKAPDFAALRPIKGLRISVLEAGIKKVARKDLTLMVLDEGASVGAVFTKNRFCAAPVQLCKAHLETGHGIRALLINTGNANAGTGEDGLMRASATCIALARLMEISPEQVLPFSTGVIMESLPHQKIIDHLPQALDALGHSSWGDAATGIMTTDTLPKAASKELLLGGERISITGISKGAGMIKPNMATMLGFMATDAEIAPACMKDLAKALADASFNRITVDGDTSTNDSFVVMATGKAKNAPITQFTSGLGLELYQAMESVAIELCQAIVRDGEGATKFITVDVQEGQSDEECMKVAYAIAHSPLVKTAFFASDPNLGRILAAVGYAGIEDLDQSLIELYLDDVHVATKGGRHPDYLEADGQRVMSQADITVRVKLGRGHHRQHVWTCDLSHEYVSINADYRS
jgi:glutamate N-acetyltransferase/amino-acid N-acetyltransferase